ncbi:Serine/threonine-protein phosphatase PP1 isozyme 4 [Trichinella nelsoni]|uniref:Serine/threonine-protein phosphatase PP1 isozyme 4 n=1 Tax=Trichinella nelsoni TaxID=6336 RepID=A0A0V0S2Z5_9BILA|nr:Serine/threonine-protein phosphatase PP1 isozyme 4 [Trichinella nelsoni]
MDELTTIEFFGNKKLITVSSVPNYCGHENASAVLEVDENSRCIILQFLPIVYCDLNIQNKNNLYIFITVTDCVLLLICDKEKTAAMEMKNFVMACIE